MFKSAAHNMLLRAERSAERGLRLRSEKDKQPNARTPKTKPTPATEKALRGPTARQHERLEIARKQLLPVDGRVEEVTADGFVLRLFERVAAFCPANEAPNAPEVDPSAFIGKLWRVFVLQNSTTGIVVSTRRSPEAVEAQRKRDRLVQARKLRR